MAGNSQFAIAVHVLTVIAKHDSGRVKSGYIAASVNTNAVVIRRTLCGLQRAGLVVSQIGAAGGTSLAKAPKDIKLSDIYASVAHGDIFALPQNEANQDCPVGRNMAAFLCGLQKEIDRSIEDKLMQFTLRDVVERIDEA